MADTRSPKRRLPFVLAFAAILAALPLGYFAFLHAPPAPPAVPPPPAPSTPVVEAPPPRPLEMTLDKVEGTVEVRRGSGEWSPARVGSTLRPSDSVRTQDGSSAVLTDGDSLEVLMHPGTEVAVDALTDELSRVLLGNGMATASVKPGARRTFELKAAGSDAIARTTSGSFTLSNNGQGTVALATREGEVLLLSQGQPVTVRAGQQSLVQPGQAPSEPAPIPSSLLLKVNWPARSTLSRRKVVLTGQTQPGSRVEVAGHSVPTDAQGRFSHELKLSEGSNRVAVRARAVGGPEQQEQQELQVDTTPPGVEVDPIPWK